MTSRSEGIWVLLAIAVHLALLGGITAQNGALEPLWGIHDAVYYTAHLADPLLQGDLSWWDNVTYRALRVGYILLALPFRWLGIVQALLIANLLSLAVGLVAVRRIGEKYMADLRLVSLVWIFNPGALIATGLLLPDTIAWTSIVLCLLAMCHKRWGWAIALGVFATLTKEASLLAIGAAGLVRAWSDRDWRPLTPAVTAGVTHLSLLTALTQVFGPSFHRDFVVWLPLSGWVKVFDIWIPDRPYSLITGLFVLASGLLVLAAWTRHRSSVFLAAAAGQSLLMIFLSEVVIFPMSNSLRVGGLFWPMLAATSLNTRRSKSPVGTDVKAPGAVRSGA